MSFCFCEQILADLVELQGLIASRHFPMTESITAAAASHVDIGMAQSRGLDQSLSRSVRSLCADGGGGAGSNVGQMQATGPTWALLADPEVLATAAAAGLLLGEPLRLELEVVRARFGEVVHVDQIVSAAAVKAAKQAATEASEYSAELAELETAKAEAEACSALTDVAERGEVCSYSNLLCQVKKESRAQTLLFGGHL